MALVESADSRESATGNSLLCCPSVSGNEDAPRIFSCVVVNNATCVAVKASICGRENPADASDESAANWAEEKALNC